MRLIAAFAMRPVAALLLLAIAAGVHAQIYPTKPVRLIVPFAPGGGTDIMARTLGQKLSELWGQQVIVDNRGGGGTIIGTELAVRSPPDGYTLMLANIALALNPGLHTKLPYDTLKDLAPIILIASQPSALAVTPGLAVNSVKDLIALARTRTAKLSFASSGNGGVGHIAGEMFKAAIGTDMVHIPYKGGGPAAIDVMSGQVPVAFISLPTVISHMKAGRIKVLAVTDSKRPAAAPDIPTVSETVPGFQVDNWIGLLAPAATPPNLRVKLNADVLRSIKMPDTRERLSAQGFDVQGSTSDEFDRVIQSDIAKYTKVIRAAGIREN
jgi:tripartite-type tricarboxylate transporter receptor subunit TctC